ncbi:alpha/beta hydrolase fold domain-containing protein [Clostridium estertheticum]|uniref:alpha/beta hydrolase fold domain-containing protein n=1 Tax=Clostridium estertheticum TaxID=238834 RepID=UPI001C0C83D0|nr:alpha/beta hydrolase fold domain-containing protein [Clostridium estertheticum]MBU3156558.1 alpha/beta hydrolase [Clostridium estertheticum]
MEYASPMQAKSFKNFPRVYVEVTEFDPLRDEGKNYADALKENGIEVEFLQTKRTIHGYDMNAASDITKGNLEKRVSALKKAFLK